MDSLGTNSLEYSIYESLNELISQDGGVVAWQYTNSRFWHFSKAQESIVCIPDPKVTILRFLQLEKVLFPMLVTELGMDTEVSPEQP